LFCNKINIIFAETAFSPHPRNQLKTEQFASIVAILKPGKDSKLPQGYRPISLLCTSYKLLERIVLSGIYPIVDPCPPKEHAGFRHGKSTVGQVTRPSQNIELAFNNKKCAVLSSWVWRQLMTLSGTRIFT